jgi:hypothetical protein
MLHNHEVNTSESDYLNKTYMGIVETIDDPRREGRCRVRVIGIHEDEVAPEDLPWAYPSQKSTVFGSDGGGSISIPKIGQVVTIEFHNGNPYSPEYKSVHELASEVKKELEDEYEGSQILLFDGDQELKIWSTPNKGLTIQLKETTINFGTDNVLTLKSPTTVVIDCPSIKLGADALESALLGETFLNLFNSHTHASNGAPPTPVPTTSSLSPTVKIE